MFNWSKVHLYRIQCLKNGSGKSGPGMLIPFSPSLSNSINSVVCKVPLKVVPPVIKVLLIKSCSGLGFPTGRDSTTFRDNGTEVSSLSRDKGTTGQAQNLAKGRDGPGQLKSGTGRAGTAKIRDGTRDKTGQDVLKQEMDVLKQERMF